MTMVGRGSESIAIVGAGIGGLMLAAALSARKILYESYERRKTLYGDGFGLNIQPPAVAELYRLGLEDQLDCVGIKTRVHRYVDHLGCVLFEEVRGVAAGFDAPQISIQRAELLALLFSKCSAERFHFDAEIVPGTLPGQRQEEAAIYPSADWVVGADGLNSVVRRSIFSDSMDINSGGVTLFRGITPMQRLLDGQTMIIANDDAGVRLIAYPVSRAWDLNGESLINWVMLVPGTLDMPISEKSTKTQVSQFLLALIKHWHFEWLDLAAMVRSSKKLMRSEMVDRDPLDKWSNQQCVLLGDAAHPMFPVGANGASQSILDAAVLAQAISQYSDMPAAIAAYEQERILAVRSIVMANRKMNAREFSSQSLERSERIDELIATTDNYRAEIIPTARKGR